MNIFFFTVKFILSTGFNVSVVPTVIVAEVVVVVTVLLLPVLVLSRYVDKFFLS